MKRHAAVESSAPGLTSFRKLYVVSMASIHHCIACWETMKRKIALALLAIALPSQAWAWDFVGLGHITSIYMANASNSYGMIVNLDAKVQNCPNGIYLSRTDANYTLYSSALLSGYLSGKVITLFGGIDSVGCRIVDMSLSNT
ncbi:hypothetical protein AZA_10982 [Nitrospirillum viridazoti Y2]|nr:hypothetical protein AZA_10982 [Nitrospirillum amazonense Y2]